MTQPAAVLRTLDTKPSFPRDVFEFLVELAVAHSRLASYPLGHPAAQTAAATVMAKLRKVLDGRSAVAIVITSDGFIVDDLVSDPRQRLLRNLARKLHDQQLGSALFTRGIEEHELQAVLEKLIRGASAEGAPLGLGSPQELEWPHCRITAIAYDKLELSRSALGVIAPDIAAPSLAKALWVKLANAAMSEDVPEENLDEIPTEGIATGSIAQLPSPAIVAHALNSAPSDFAGAHRTKVVTGVLVRLVQQASLVAEDTEATSIQRYLSELISSLSEETLERLMQMHGDPMLRQKFLVAASEGLAADAIVALARASADASKMAISSPMLRMMSKMAAQSLPGSEADSSLRSLVRQTVATWGPGHSAPRQYLDLIDQMSTQVPDIASLRGTVPVSPFSIAAMGLELGLINPIVCAAAWRVISDGDTGILLDALAVEDKHNDLSAADVRRNVLRPETLLHLLRNSAVDFNAIERIAREMELASVDPLVDVLSVTGDRALRSRLLALLAELGQGVGSIVARRLPGSAWYVQRNLLELLGRLGDLPPGISLGDYARHNDARVRRAALKVILKDSARREEGILLALEDQDDDILRMGLATVMESCPSSAIPLVRKRYERGDLDSEMRALCIRVLAPRRDPALLQKLVSLTMIPRKLLRKERLQEKSPEMIAAIGALATYWREDVRAISVLLQASASLDPEIRASVQQWSRESQP